MVGDLVIRSFFLETCLLQRRCPWARPGIRIYQRAVPWCTCSCFLHLEAFGNVLGLNLERCRTEILLEFAWSSCSSDAAAGCSVALEGPAARSGCCSGLADSSSVSAVRSTMGVLSTLSTAMMRESILFRVSRFV